MRVGRLLYPEAESLDRPKTRADCIDGIRPCPFVGCRFHLFLDAGRSGNLRFNFPDLEPWDLTYSCALDVADAGQAAGEGVTLEVVGNLINVTRERVRQVEDLALDRANVRLGRLLGEVRTRPKSQARRWSTLEVSDKIVLDHLGKVGRATTREIAVNAFHLEGAVRSRGRNRAAVTLRRLERNGKVERTREGLADVWSLAE